MQIRVGTFKGMIPVLDPPALPDNAAQSATNVDFSGGTLRPLLGLEYIGATQLDRSGTTSAMYRFVHGNNTPAWLKWVGEDVSMCLSPVPADQHGKVFWTTSAGKPRYSFYTAIVTGGGAYPNASYDLGIPVPGSFTAAAAGAANPDPPDTLLDETRAYVITFVEAISGAATFEGPPSAPVTVTVHQGQTVDLSGLPTKPNGDNLIAYKRIYRTNTGSSSTEYQYVGTVAVATTTFSDTLADDALGEILPSATWIAPPTNLQGLISLPSGSLAGFAGNTIYFSVPYVPSAWPAEYDMTVDFPIVSIAAFGNGILVTTKGNPYVISGVTPGGMGIEKLELGTACQSAKGLIDFGDAIVYPSTRGLVTVGVQGVQNLTEGLINQKTWEALHPATMLAARYDTFYIGWTDNAQLILNIKTGDYALHSLGWTPACVWTDPIDGSLYLAKAETGNDGLYRWGKGTAATAIWKSKKFRIHEPNNMAAARVIAESYSSVTFKLYADSVLKHTQTVTSSQPFRLPAGYLANDWEIEIVTTSTVYEVSVATTMSELVA